MKDAIKIKGARTHNLKDVSLEIPKNKLVIFSGVSGSGKSSLAFDTIFAEGQRRYIESLSPYARQFLGQMEKPDVDEIEGLSPAIAIDQKAHSHNPRSTVATLTEIYDYLRVLFARIGKPFCPECGSEIKKMSADEIADFLEETAARENAPVATVLAPVVRGRKGEYFQLLQDLFSDGFGEARIDGKFYSLRERIELPRYKMHTIEIVVDRVPLADRQRLFEAVETAIERGGGLVGAVFPSGKEFVLSSLLSCPRENFSLPEIEPRLFSFNSPYGACEGCHGIGHDFIDINDLCSACGGRRLKKEALAVKITGRNISDLTSLTIDEAYEFFATLDDHLSENEKLIAKNVLKEIIARLEFLLEVGLDYIALNRESWTLSGGESQRIRLAGQIGSKLSGALYVLDEPTIGLHERDNEKLLKILKNLRDLGNTVIVVEHDERIIRESDYFVDLGPGPGRNGGEIVKTGVIGDVLKSKSGDSLTARYLKGEEKIEIPRYRRKDNKGVLKIIGAAGNNIKNLNVEVPLGKFVCVTGVSGSGKSTLLEDVICKNVRRKLGGFSRLENVSGVSGTEYLHRVVEIDQSPIGRTPRSNPATYTGVFTPIRDLFSLLPEAGEKGYKSGRFSFNVPGGRCESCEGAGYKLVEMHFLPAVLVRCEVCRGRRFNSETLAVKYQGKNIADILEMTVDDAYGMFENIYSIADKLKVLRDVGLGYIRLGQGATTLSGGEAQRIKLAKELARPMARKTLFLLDEPTTGLHFEDVKMLLKVLQGLVDKGNTVVVIEHNLHVIKTVDYVIDMGPEGGEGGGRVIAKGTPEEVAADKKSSTGAYLKKVLAR